MRNLCIISGPVFISETFIRAHEERLCAPNKRINGVFPEFFENDKKLEFQYKKHKRVRRFLKLIPHLVYERLSHILEPSGYNSAEALREFLVVNKIDAILAEYGMTGADITPIAKEANIPLIVHFHGHDAYHHRYLRDYQARFKELFSYASYIISVSKDMTRQLLTLGAPIDKIVLNPCGPAEKFFNVQPEYGDIFLAVGRFVETKAPHLTISAFKLLADECPAAKLIMVGDGPLREACMSLAAGLGLVERVEFPGALRHEHTLKLLEKACCFVQHSMTTSDGVKEGTPVAILEAGAACLPVVSTRHAGIADVVQEGLTGFLVDEMDVLGMKNYMQTLFNDRALCRMMGEKARLEVSKKYNIENHICILQKLIDSLS